MGLIRTHPALVDLLDRNCVEVIPTLAAHAPNDNQSRLFEDGQMLHDGKSRKFERHAQLARRSWFVAQCIQKPPSRWIGEGFPNGFQEV